MRRTFILVLAGALAVAACSASAASAPATTAGAATATSPATVAPSAAAKSVVCEFYPRINQEVADAAGQAMMGGNAAAATRQAINDIEALAA